MDHEYIAEIVNARDPGYGVWAQIPRMDHGLHQWQDFARRARCRAALLRKMAVLADPIVLLFVV